VRSERGQALVEAIVLGLLLIIPLVWLLTVLADVHRSALAVTAGARDAGGRAARATSVGAAGRAVDAAVAEALAGHGLDPSKARVRWSAPPGFRRGGAVEVEVSYSVPVFGAPFLGSVSSPSVWVRGRHVARIDLYRSREP